jgi:hypothetical protein
MRRDWSYFGVIMLFYVALVVPASIGAFALGELGNALFLVLGISVPLVALCVLADLLTPAPTPARPADNLEAEG